MQIQQAIKAFDEGKRIYRASWDHLETLGFEKGSDPQFIGGFPAGAYMSAPNNTSELYLFSLADIRATDWQMISGASR